MPGIPGPAGFAAFTGVKFVGYWIAGDVMTRHVAAIQASRLKIAVVRTILGIVLGLPTTFAWVWIASFFLRGGSSPATLYVAYTGLVAVRIVIWAFVLFVFSSRSAYPTGRLWFHAALCGAWSCLLDLPGLFFSFMAPGATAIC